VVNQESTTLKSAFGWIGRQLLTVRLYHRAWPLILIHAILGGICFFAPLVLVMVTAIQDRPLAIWTTLVWLIQLGLNIVVLDYIRTLNLNAIQKSAPKTTNASGLLSKLTTATALQAIYPFLAIGVVFRQRTRWRGIDYRIGRQGEIEMDSLSLAVADVQPPDYSSVDITVSKGSDQSIFGGDFCPIP